MSKPTESRQRNKNQFYSYIDTLREKSDLPMMYVLGSVGITLLLVFFGVLDLHITNIVSVILPAYWTMRAMEREDKEEEKQWISYWFIWAFLFLFDLLIPFYMKKIPYYYFAKLVFLTWLYLPNTRGALYLYNNYFIKAGPFDFTKLTRYTDKLAYRINHFLDSFFHTSLKKEKEHEGVSRARSASQDKKCFVEKMHEEPLSSCERSIGKLEEIRQQLYETTDRIRDVRENVNSDRGEKIPIDEKYGLEEEHPGTAANDFTEERIITPHSDKVICHTDKVMDLSQNIKDIRGREKTLNKEENKISYDRKIQ